LPCWISGLRKAFDTFFFPVSDEPLRIVEAWVGYLREEKLWGNDDPLFPATHIAQGADRQFAVSGLDREHWSSASPIRAIFREAFHRAGLPYFNPHSIRNTLVRLGEDLCKSPENSKHGARTWDTRRSRRRSSTMVLWHVIAKARFCEV
jgi:hypothetical protein